MTQLELIRLLEEYRQKAKKSIFTLRELSLLAKEAPTTMGMTLIRAQKKGIVFRVGRQWVNLMTPPPLEQIGFTCRSPSYVSFESALYRRGIISQAPRGRLTLAVRGRPDTIITPIGTLQFTHISGALFFGYDQERMAYAEKAILDLIYIRGKAGLKPLFTEEVYWDLLDKKRLMDFARKFQPWVGRAVQALLPSLLLR